jgi:YegS/Rv2252/BmrU family lipid kinase
MPERRVRACLITNPRGGRGALDLTPALPILRDAGWAVTVRQKDAGGAAVALAREAARQGYDVVVDCAGDGTLNEIVAGLVGTEVAVGVLPGGTVNLWAAELGVDRRLRVAAAQLVGATRHRVDVGRVTIDGTETRYFLLVAGLGLDGAVMARVAKPLKRRLGVVAVGLAALRALPTFASVPVRATLDDLPWEGRVVQIIVGNTRRYGGITRITPAAYVDDGQFDVCLVTAGGVLDAGRQVGALLFKQRPAATAETYRVGHVVVEAPGRIPLQLDGSAVHQRGAAPGPDGARYTFSLIAGGLSVLVPKTYDGALFRDGGVGRRAADRRAGVKGRWLRVLAVGADAITAARVKDGRVFTIVRGPKVIARDATGARRRWRPFLGSLAAGDLLRVKGKRERGRGRIRARRIRLRPPPDRA